MTLLPPSIRDERSLTFEQLIERISAIDLAILNVYNIDTVTDSALYDLADQFNVLGLRGWLLASNALERRNLIKEAIVLHKRAGTAYAIRRSMALVGYPSATVTENPAMVYDGSWKYDGKEYYEGNRIFGFIVTLDSQQSEVSVPLIQLIIGLINEWKNARSELLDLRIGNVSLLSNLMQYDSNWSYDGTQQYDGVRDI